MLNAIRVHEQCINDYCQVIWTTLQWMMHYCTWTNCHLSWDSSLHSEIEPQSFWRLCLRTVPTVSAQNRPLDPTCSSLLLTQFCPPNRTFFSSLCKDSPLLCQKNDDILFFIMLCRYTGYIVIFFCLICILCMHYQQSSSHISNFSILR